MVILDNESGEDEECTIAMQGKEGGVARVISVQFSTDADTVSLK